jgi:PAS domain S-box-containing protein
MNSIIRWIETSIEALPLPMLEVWGRLATLVGYGLAIVAFGGLTFRPGGRWGLGRERQAWDAKAVLSIPITFILIIVSGYLGSFIVLVPEAQTFESLKDLVVLLCILLFGYPALITVPFAYGLSDLIEGVPPEFLLDWLPGYFINPSCFWIAYLLIGRNPDFRRLRTWGLYLLFVALFMAIEPMLWGHICAGKFTAAISYPGISAALFFTTGITWILAPPALLVALPAARRFGMFWAEIPGHVRERVLGRKEWIWTAGKVGDPPATSAADNVWPIRMLLLAPFIALVLVMVGATAYVTLHSAKADAEKLAIRLHQEIADSIQFQLDDHLARPPGSPGNVSDLLRGMPVAQHGVALVVDRSGDVIGSSAKPGDPVAAKAVARLGEAAPRAEQLKAGFEYRFDHVTAKPLHRETWLARAEAYRVNGRDDWRLVTVMPESYYQAGVKAGSSRSALVFAVALLSSLAVAAVLATLMTGRLRRMSAATHALALGDLKQRVPGSRLEELDGLARSFNDMAERLQKSFEDLNSQVELRKSAELQFRGLLESAPEAMVIIDGGGGVLLVNSRAEQIFGYPRAEILGKPVSLIVPGGLEAGVLGRRKDGTEFPAEISVSPLETERGTLLSGAIRDVTQRHKAEADLRASEERFRELAETIADAFWVSDPERRRIHYISPAYGKIWGRSCRSLLEAPESWLESIHPEDRERVRRAVAAQPDGETFDQQYRILRPDGAERWIRDLAYPVRNREGRIERIVGVARDITEPRTLEQQLRQSQKMEAVGQLAGGVAHDFNNMLTVILMQVALASEEGGASAESLASLKEIRLAAERAADLTRQLLLFSRKQVMQPRDLDLNQIVGSLAKMLERIIGEDVALELRVAAEPLVLRIDSGMIGQVLMNLAVNARDAMPDGGRLLIETAVMEVDQAQACLHPGALPGHYAALSVSDTGTGIAPEVLPRIFDPFFTTKAPGKGTGLGLATVFGIVEQHGGWIQVSSRLGQGTSFRIFLPLSAASAPEAGVDSAKPGPQRGTERILLVEDDDAVRRLTRTILERSGYRVLEAGSGVDALKVWPGYRDEVGLLLTDLMLPGGIGGQELARKLLEDRRDLKVIFTSGYSADIAGRALTLREGESFLQKPCPPDRLLEAVRRILDGRPR